MIEDLPSLRNFYLSFLTPAHTRAFEHFTLKYGCERSASVFAVLTLYVMDHAPVLIASQNHLDVNAKCPSQHDLITVMRVLLPFLDIEDIDPIAISRNGLHPPAIRQLRSILERSAECPVFLAAAGMSAWVDRQPGAIDGVVESLFASMRATEGVSPVHSGTKVLGQFTARYPNEQFAPVFAVLVLSVIQRFESLITDHRAPGLTAAFCAESDVVTVYRALLPFLENDIADPATVTRNGFDLAAVLELRNVLEDTAECPMSVAAVGMNKWVAKQPNEIFGAIDSLLESIESIHPNWTNECVCNFRFVLGAAPNSNPYLSYQNTNRLVEIRNRPGWIGLAAPGTAFVLSIFQNPTTQTLCGRLLHRVSGRESFGVVAIPASPVLSSPFGIALLQAYIGHDVIADSFVGIQRGEAPDKITELLLFVTYSKGESQMNCCPKSTPARDQMQRAIPVVSALLPFTPRSVIVHRQNPRCVAEITSIGADKYSTTVHFLADKDIPVAYAITPSLLDSMSRYLRKLAVVNPKHRFAVTGEALIYRTERGVQQDIELLDPDTRPELTTVFANTASHLVFLIDADRHRSSKWKRIHWTGNSRPALAYRRFPFKEKELRRELLSRLSINGGEPVCHAVCFSDRPSILPQPLYVFHRDGLAVQSALCQGCAETAIGQAVQHFFDRRNGLVRQNQLADFLEALAPLPTVTSDTDDHTREAWPSVPLGAAIWTLCSSRDAPLVKAWVTGTVDILVRVSLRAKTFCPNHPSILYPMPSALQTLNCPSCNLMFCMSCRTWHEKTRNCEALPPDVKCCPFCQVPIHKQNGCSHIACRCGKHWCWICGQGCDTAQDVHEHIYARHRVAPAGE
jgi:hypothetical protein